MFNRNFMVSIFRAPQCSPTWTISSFGQFHMPITPVSIAVHGFVNKSIFSFKRLKTFQGFEKPLNPNIKCTLTTFLEISRYLRYVLFCHCNSMVDKHGMERYGVTIYLLKTRALNTTYLAMKTCQFPLSLCTVFI